MATYDALPTGTVTFLLTDIQGSTPLWEREPEAMAQAMDHHDALVAEVLARYGGVKPRDQGEGDSVLAAFASASAALECAADLQRALGRASWPTSEPISVRMAVHTGDVPPPRRGNYEGVTIIRAARVRALAGGGEVFVTGATAEIVAGRLPDACTLVDLGRHLLKGLRTLEHVLALQHPELRVVDRTAAPSDASGPVNLPRPATSFVGREEERKQLAGFLRESPIVTLVGEGGAGKSRLAIQTAADEADEHPDGVWFVDLAPLTSDEQVPRAVADAVGLVVDGGRPMTEALVDRFRDARVLLLFDNAEQ